MTQYSDSRREDNVLILIAGATGKMGSTYLNSLSQRPHTRCIGLTSDPKKVGWQIQRVNILDQQETKDFISRLPVYDYREVYFIYSIGPFLFEENGMPNRDQNQDGIDDRVYELNFSGFRNFADPLIERVGELPDDNKPLVTLCAFGSISDRYEVPWWQSYSKSKNLLREYIRSRVNGKTRALFINLSSAEKEPERPLADKTYWLTCQEVFDSTFRALFDTQLYWQEVDIFRPNPSYYSGFFQDHEGLKNRWVHDMGRGVGQYAKI